MQSEKIGAISCEQYATGSGSYAQDNAVRRAGLVRLTESLHIMAPLPKQLDQKPGLAVFVKQQAQAGFPRR